MKLGLLGKLLAVMFVVLCIGGSFGGGNMFQANQSYAAVAGAIPWFEGKAWLYGILLAFLVGLVILGRPLLSLIYGGDEFADSNDVLAILAWGSLAGTVASVLGRVLIAALQEITTLRIAVVNTVLQLILAVVLTQQFGIQGTAFAVLVTALVNVAQHAFPVRKSLGSFIDPRGMAVPILASAAMAIVLVVLPDIHVLLATLVGIVVYFVSFAGVAVVVAGGWSGVKQSWSLSVPSGDPG